MSTALSQLLCWLCLGPRKGLGRPKWRWTWRPTSTRQEPVDIRENPEGQE
jgi:hypothetical protein